MDSHNDSPCVVQPEAPAIDLSADHFDDSTYSVPIEEYTSYEERDDIVGIPASRLEEHIQYLLQRTDQNGDPYWNGFDDEFAFIEQQTTQDQYFGDYTSAMLPHNKNKNRYSNVLPTERTRVRLAVTEEDGSDFINANYINGLIPGTERAYIATQGPLASTFFDFWRMIWELQVTVIVMLTREIENDRIKCDRYWPEPDCPMNCGTFKITLADIEETCKDELITRRLLVYNMDTEEEKEVVQLQYIAWPDHGIPVSTTAFLDLIDEADSFNYQKAPIVVHCSAGIGRSGTFCTVHSTLEKLKMELAHINETNIWREPTFNIPQTVLYMRSQRPGMVQTKEQYMFIYLTILEKVRELFVSLSPSLGGFQDEIPEEWRSDKEEFDEFSSSSEAHEDTEHVPQSRSRSRSRSRSNSTETPTEVLASSVATNSSTESESAETEETKSAEPLHPIRKDSNAEPLVKTERSGSVDVSSILEEVNHEAQGKGVPVQAE